MAEHESDEIIYHVLRDGETDCPVEIPTGNNLITVLIWLQCEKTRRIRGS